MMLRKLLAIPLMLFPLLASAHNLVVGQRVAPISITDRGEMLMNGDDFSYRPWKSAQLEGKIRVVQYIAGRTSAKKKNSLLIKAIKAADFPLDRFQPTTIVNTDDEIPGSGFFVRGKLEKNKRKYPWAQFIVDSNGLGRKAWQLKEESSTILVLDKDGRVQWAKDGALTTDEVYNVLAMVHDMLLKERD
ncbi:YtfJ family protein [Shimwellia pseudoproteus]|uniref:YtfJ family protein n=1 Tax=Shimwellia pseudoproteus TaxID=570012 RepID=UPI0018EC7DAA|nr:YtfJ family protein [Shimwellia pseudoproteus]MBJ3815721.1 YtfJ family protein [Shimwellia pseudoproteus]